MNVVPFDTLASPHVHMRRDEAGFDEKQAEGLLRTISATLQDSVVSKRDLRDAIEELNARIERLEARLTFMQWMLAAVAIGILTLVLKAFIP